MRFAPSRQSRVREGGQSSLHLDKLIEVAARKEILMMVPVVFLVLPVTVLFAFCRFWASLERAYKPFAIISRSSRVRFV